jgi:hypothetical protein
MKCNKPGRRKAKDIKNWIAATAGAWLCTATAKVHHPERKAKRMPVGCRIDVMGVVERRHTHHD